MGDRGHGTYAKLFRDVWTHPKTFRLAEALTAKLGVPDRWSVSVAVGQFHQLLCWCVAERDDGQVGHLPAQVFARIVGWDELRRASELLQLWKESGFLDVVGPNDVRVHDFREAAADLLRKRDARRPAAGQRPDNGRPDKAEVDRTLSGQRPPDGAPAAAQRATDGPPVDVQRPPDGRPAAALARAFGSGSGSGSGMSSLRSDLFPAPADAGPGEGAEPEPSPKRRTRKPPDAGPPGLSANPLVAAFQAAYQAAFGALPAIAAAPGGYAGFARTIGDIARAKGLDPSGLRRVADAFCTVREEWVVGTGHSAVTFAKHFERWHRLAFGGVEAAEPETALDKAKRGADRMMGIDSPRLERVEVMADGIERPF